MDKGYIVFTKEEIEYSKKIGHPLPVDENNGMEVEGIFDCGCTGDEGPLGNSIEKLS